MYVIVLSPHKIVPLSGNPIVESTLNVLEPIGKFPITLDDAVILKVPFIKLLSSYPSNKEILYVNFPLFFTISISEIGPFAVPSELTKVWPIIKSGFEPSNNSPNITFLLM